MPARPHEAPGLPALQTSAAWPANVPEHWEVKWLKTSATCCVSNVGKVSIEDEMPERLCDYTDVYYHDHITPNMGLMETTATADEIRRSALLRSFHFIGPTARTSSKRNRTAAEGGKGSLSSICSGSVPAASRKNGNAGPAAR